MTDDIDDDDDDESDYYYLLCITLGTQCTLCPKNAPPSCDDNFVKS